MPTSEARMIANRKNAALSTGPKSAEGKVISRANGLKHGLTGLGIVLREDDQAEVERRSLAMIAELQPGTETGLQLVRRAAVLSVRVERCAELETAATSARVRSAWDHFDDDQRDEADALFATLAEKPWATLRRLQRTFAGVDRLIQGWQDLKTDLEANVWTRSHGERMSLLSGYRLDDCHAVRFLKLSDAVEGSPSVENVGPMLAVIDVELDSLKELLETFDDDEIDHQRAEAAARALLVPNAEAILARRYEAAAERGLYRALREARIVENQPTLTDQPQAGISTTRTTAPTAPLGSSFPASQPATVAPPAPRKPLSPESQAKFDAMFPDQASEAGKFGSTSFAVGRVG